MNEFDSSLETQTENSILDCCEEDDMDKTNFSTESELEPLAMEEELEWKKS